MDTRADLDELEQTTYTKRFRVLTYMSKTKRRPEPFVVLSIRVPAGVTFTYSGGIVCTLRPTLGDYLTPNPNGSLLPFIEALPSEILCYEALERGVQIIRVRQEVTRWDRTHQRVAFLVTGVVAAFLDFHLFKDQLFVTSFKRPFGVPLEICGAYDPS